MPQQRSVVCSTRRGKGECCPASRRTARSRYRSTLRRQRSPDRSTFLGSWTARVLERQVAEGDRKSTRLNSSHSQISYAVFCLKKKKRAPCTPPTPRYRSP